MFVTGNANKLHEVRSILSSSGITVEAQSVDGTSTPHIANSGAET